MKCYTMKLNYEISSREKKKLEEGQTMETSLTYGQG